VVQLLLVTAGLLLTTAVYLGAMRATLDLSQVRPGNSPETRDSAYLVVHSGVVAFSLVLGFATGRFAGGLGFAYATLFAAVALVMMAAVQTASFAIACDGHNDLVRHWQC